MTPTERIVSLEADVARLQWEVARLNETVRKVIAAADQIDEWNQGLIKAGDEMAEVCGWTPPDQSAADALVQEWNRAKEGIKP